MTGQLLWPGARALCRYVWAHRHAFTGIAMLQDCGDKLYQQAPREGVVTAADIAKAPTLSSLSESQPASEVPGEGVGLSIVKRLCELLDASLELETSPGKGSTFRVILPRYYAPGGKQ